MRLSSVRWGRTKSANYQAERAEIEIEMEKGDTFEATLARAKALVDIALGEGPTEEQVREAERILSRSRALNKARALPPPIGGDDPDPYAGDGEEHGS